MGRLAKVVEKYVDHNRPRNCLISALGFALCVGLYEGVIVREIEAERTIGLRAAYAIVNLWESAFFGFGVAFFFVYGRGILALEKSPLKQRCIAIWIAISYFFISWFPHATAHQFLTLSRPKDFIILEVNFHWPNLAAAFVLCYYQFDVILMSYSVALNNKVLRGYTDEDLLPKPWYWNVKLHATILSIMGSIAWGFFAWRLNPLRPDIETWEKAFLITIYITDGASSGIGLGFSYAASMYVHRLPKRKTRVVASVSVICIAYMLTIATPHPVTHAIVARDPYHTVMLEYLFHFSMTAAVAILAYFQHRFLVMAISGRIPKLIMTLKEKKAVESLTSDSDKKKSKSNKSDSAGVQSVELPSIEVRIHDGSKIEE